MSAIVQYFKHSLALPFFRIGVKTDLFQSCGHCCMFQIFWHIECSTFTESSFRIWNSSAGISSPPLALLTVMLPKAHLTSHSRMSGSRWVIIPSWLSGSLIAFLHSSSVYSCHLFLISSASVRSIPFLSLIVPIFARSAPLVSLIFLKRSLVFGYFAPNQLQSFSYLSDRKWNLQRSFQWSLLSRSIYAHSCIFYCLDYQPKLIDTLGIYNTNRILQKLMLDPLETLL